MPFWLIKSVKVMPHGASVRQDSLRQDSLRHRVAYRAPGFERSCAQNRRKTHWGMNIDMYGQEWSIHFIENYFIWGTVWHHPYIVQAFVCLATYSIVLKLWIALLIFFLSSPAREHLVSNEEKHRHQDCRFRFINKTWSKSARQGLGCDARVFCPRDYQPRSSRLLHGHVVGRGTLLYSVSC